MLLQLDEQRAPEMSLQKRLGRVGLVCLITGVLLTSVFVLHPTDLTSYPLLITLRSTHSLRAPTGRRLSSIMFDGCTDGRIERLAQAHDNAIQQVTKALDELPGGQHHKFKRDLRWWFGKDSSRNDHAIKQRFTKMKHAMENENIQYTCASSSDDRCAPKNNPFGDGAIAYVNPGSQDPIRIWICPIFFDGLLQMADNIFPREPEGIERNGAAHADVGQQSRPGILVHEFSHLEHVADTDDIEDGDYFKIHALAESDPEKAQRNANNWQAFAETGNCWANGKLCGLGTTCKNCCAMKATYWLTKAMTACGSEPCWKKGATCGKGTTCKLCCNGHKSKWYWAGFAKCKR